MVSTYQPTNYRGVPQGLSPGQLVELALERANAYGASMRPKAYRAAMCAAGAEVAPIAPRSSRTAERLPWEETRSARVRTGVRHAWRHLRGKDKFSPTSAKDFLGPMVSGVQAMTLQDMIESSKVDPLKLALQRISSTAQQKKQAEGAKAAMYGFAATSLFAAPIFLPLCAYHVVKKDQYRNKQKAAQRSLQTLAILEARARSVAVSSPSPQGGASNSPTSPLRGRSASEGHIVPSSTPMSPLRERSASEGHSAPSSSNMPPESQAAPPAQNSPTTIVPPTRPPLPQSPASGSPTPPPAKPPRPALPVGGFPSLKKSGNEGGHSLPGSRAAPVKSSSPSGSRVKAPPPPRQSPSSSPRSGTPVNSSPQPARSGKVSVLDLLSQAEKSRVTSSKVPTNQGGTGVEKPKSSKSKRAPQPPQPRQSPSSSPRSGTPVNSSPQPARSGKVSVLNLLSQAEKSRVTSSKVPTNQGGTGVEKPKSSKSKRAPQTPPQSAAS